MRKKILTLVVASSVNLAMFATNMYVKQYDGTITKFNVADIEEVYFGEDDEDDSSVVDADELNFTLKVLDDFSAEVSSVDKYGEDIVIPAKVRIDGKVYTVTGIGDDAFTKMGIKSVVIPSTVTRIGNYAFYGNECESIDIPSSVTFIGESAFMLSFKLTSIKIPSGVTVIENSAFEDCMKLTKVEIPSSVISIGKDAFGYCPLAEIVIDNVEGGVQIGDNAFDGVKSVKYLR